MLTPKKDPHFQFVTETNGILDDTKSTILTGYAIFLCRATSEENRITITVEPSKIVSDHGKRPSDLAYMSCDLHVKYVSQGKKYQVGDIGVKLPYKVKCERV